MIEEAKEIYKKYCENNNINFKNIYVVWFSKTLQNWKALVSADNDDKDMPYMEITHDGDKNQTYVDVYVKYTNYVI